MDEFEIEAKSDSLIGGWFIDPLLCDKIIEQFDSNPALHVHDKTGNRNYTLFSGDFLSPELDKEYSAAVQNVLKLYSKRYEYVVKFNQKWAMSRPYNVQKYNPGDYYSTWHAETVGPRPGSYLRHLTFMTYLNDCDGGTRFLHQNVTVEPKKGLTLIWPAGWTHIHRGVPATVDKYITTGWTIFTHKIL